MPGTLAFDDCFTVCSNTLKSLYNVGLIFGARHRVMDLVSLVVVGHRPSSYSARHEHRRGQAVDRKGDAIIRTVAVQGEVHNISSMHTNVGSLCARGT